MSKRTYQEARDFVAADWENLKPESRATILNGYKIPEKFKNVRWGLLPPTIKHEITMTLSAKGKPR